MITPELQADVERLVDLMATKGEDDAIKEAAAMRRYIAQNSNWLSHHAVICLKTIRYSNSFTKKFDADDRLFVAELLERIRRWQDQN